VPPTGNGEGGEGGENGSAGYWKTEYRQEQRSEQVWVNAVEPLPGMSQTTATYVPGYVVPGRPTSYSLASTTAQNPLPISTQISGPLGVAATWTPIGANGGYQSSRPTVERTYDRWGNVASVTDPRSAYWITRYTYNANNQMTSEVRPNSDGGVGAGPATYLYYDAVAIMSPRATRTATSMASNTMPAAIAFARYMRMAVFIFTSTTPLATRWRGSTRWVARRGTPTTLSAV